MATCGQFHEQFLGINFPRQRPGSPERLLRHTLPACKCTLAEDLIVGSHQHRCKRLNQKLLHGSTPVCDIKQGSDSIFAGAWLAVCLPMNFLEAEVRMMRQCRDRQLCGCDRCGARGIRWASRGGQA